MNISADNPQNRTYDELVEENQTLRNRLEELFVEKRYTWRLYLETGRRLQVSSASIKAAVSSLLNYEIFWDPANQHEFLQTIDNSVDRSSKLVLLLTLAFRTEAAELPLNREPQVFQEILAVLQADLSRMFPGLVEKFNLPKDGEPVLVDYEYLIIALKYLFEFFNSRTDIDKLVVRIEESRRFWLLEVDGLDLGSKQLIETMQSCKTDDGLSPDYLVQPEYLLGLHVACEILHLQAVDISVVEKPDGVLSLRLHIPAYLKDVGAA